MSETHITTKTVELIKPDGSKIVTEERIDSHGNKFIIETRHPSQSETGNGLRDAPGEHGASMTSNSSNSAEHDPSRGYYDQGKQTAAEIATTAAIAHQPAYSEEAKKEKKKKKNKHSGKKKHVHSDEGKKHKKKRKKHKHGTRKKLESGKLWIFRVPGYTGSAAGIGVRIVDESSGNQILYAELRNLQDPLEVEGLGIGKSYIVDCKETPLGCYCESKPLVFLPTAESPVGCVTIQYSSLALVGACGGCFCGIKVIDLAFVTPQVLGAHLDKALKKAGRAGKLASSLKCLLCIFNIVGTALGAGGGVSSAAMGPTQGEFGEKAEKFKREMLDGNDPYL